MHSSMLLGAVMAMGALAAPAVQVVDVLDTVTVTVTAGHGAPTAVATVPAAPAPANNNGGGFLEGSAPATPTAAPSSPPSGGSSPVSGVSDDQQEILDVVNKWRRKYNIQTCDWDSSMNENVQQVGEDGHGVNEVHQLIPGKPMGQVITPGQINPVPVSQKGFSPFEIAYIAWLCEVPTDQQLQPESNDGVDVCGLVQSVLHMEYSDTGHHAILVSPNYNGVSCKFSANPNADQSTAVYQGLWVCDFSS